MIDSGEWFISPKYKQSLYNEDAGEKEATFGKRQSHFPKTVTRQEALEIADSYYQYNWTASAANITNGQITDPDGNALETPEWCLD